MVDGSVPCPSSSDSCKRTDLAWQSSSSSATGFRVYLATIGLDPNATCADERANAKVVVEVGGSARTAQYFQPLAVGTANCWWVSAVNEAGESDMVAALGQTPPAAPTSFTATIANGSMPCPSASSDSCKRTDLTWQDGSANVTGFRIYVASIAGLDPNAKCADAVQDAGLAIAVGSSARTAGYYWPISTGVAYCYWITAVSDAGESAKVAAAGQN